MTVNTEIKICGLKDPGHVAVAAEEGADYVGFIFFAKSPRNLTLMEAIALGKALNEKGPKRVGVFVNADIPFIEDRVKALNLDIIQLHGAERPSDVSLIKKVTGLPVWKAIAVSEDADIEKAIAYTDIADAILFDAKPPNGSDLPGGNAISFPWYILQGKDIPLPWLMAGGLTAENALQAIAESGAKALDVSSGVEVEPGKKSADLIKTFLRTVKGAK